MCSCIVGGCYRCTSNFCTIMIILLLLFYKYNGPRVDIHTLQRPPVSLIHVAAALDGGTHRRICTVDPMHRLLDGGHQRIWLARCATTILAQVRGGGGLYDIHSTGAHRWPQRIERRGLLVHLVAPVVDDDVKALVGLGCIRCHLYRGAVVVSPSEFVKHVLQ